MSEISEVNGKRQREKNAESWVIEVKKAIGSENGKWEPSMWEQSENVCIYRIPKSIMSCNELAYVPSVAPLGPYGHNLNSINLSPMDKQKRLAVKQVLERIPEGGNSLTEKFAFLTKEIEKFDDKIRKCYDEEIALDEETLSTMMAMDACFILEFFKRNHQITAISDIMNDIMKLENQIPLFVLKTVLELEHGTEEVVDKLSKLLEGNIWKLPFSPEGLPRSSLENYIKENDPFHLLDLQRMVLVDLLAANESNDNTSIDSSNGFTPSAKLLRKAGIKFQNGPIGFESGKFSLPGIIVDDNTEILLRNLMAYEECQLCSKLRKPLISQFVCLLDDLIESEEDVHVLKKDGIIEHLLGSDKEVADIINQLCKGIREDRISDFHYAFLMAKEEYYVSPWKKRIRRVKEAHCSKPLYWVSILAGTSILVMTAVQMAYAIKKG